MTKVLTSLELSVVVKELQQLVGSKVNKIHQPSSRILMLDLFKTGGHKFLVKVDSGVGMFATSYSVKNPLTPFGFCLFLRKHLNGSKLVALIQNKLERIIEFHFDTKDGLRILVCELFSKGNFVLCDGAYKIINCAAVQQWKDRTIKRGEIYKYPPEGFNLMAIDKITFQSYLNKYPQHEIVRLIATLGFGGTYSEEICLGAKIQKNTVVQMLKVAEVERIYTQVAKVLSQFSSSNSSEIIYDEGKPVDATAFPISFYADKEKKQIDSFNQALDVLYTSEVASNARRASDSKYQQEKHRLDNIYNAQKKSYNQYEEDAKNSQRIADMIYSQYNTIYTIFSKIKAAVDAGYDWYDVHQVLQREKDSGIYEANLVKEIKPETRQIIIDIGEELALDLTKSLEENAGDYYDKSKKAKAKIEGAHRTLEDARFKLEQLEQNRESMQQASSSIAPKLIERKKQEWFEKFHWFLTSSGLLAIGGRDATTNEILVKKHTEFNDFIFHTDIAGSPFFILKEGRNKSTEQDLKEVAQTTASYSAAWKLGVGSTDVYQVKPEQVTKEAQPGEYLGKGSFMVRGKKNYFRNTELEIAIGVDKQGRIMAGALTAIQKHCKQYAVVKQGDQKKSDIAKQLSHKFGVDSNTIMPTIPTGESQVTSVHD
jgi:predicted ribosome quality control (RQC) complex YloA/Tae2 family protein